MCDSHKQTHIHCCPSSFQGIRWIFVSLLPKNNLARCVGVSTCFHMCVCALFSALSVHSEIFPTFISLSLSTVLHLRLSFPLLFLPISLSDEQIELLNELFLWAPNAHPKLSIWSFSLSVLLLPPPLPHPSIPPSPKPHSYVAHLLAATMFK